MSDETFPVVPPTEDSAGAPRWDPNFLGELRRQMLRFATLQLSDPHAAEDAVQEAWIGALKNAASFGGRSAFRTWVFAILKNKIADELRRRQRFADASSLPRSYEEGEDAPELFDQRGFWHPDRRPQPWPDPEVALHDAQFWQVFEACLDRLPPQQARVFMMREFLEFNTPEICTTVGISVSNLHVILHRARLKLRNCLEKNWFQGVQPC